MATKKMYKRAGKKKMTGGQQDVPAASFLEPPIAQPFAQQPMVQQNPAEFTAKKGGERKKALSKMKKRPKYEKGGEKENLSVRDLRKKQRAERRADRKSDREAIRTLKKKSKEGREDMTREERRADRQATRKASRVFRRQERKARRQDRKEDRQERRDLRTKLKQEKKDAKKTAVSEKLSTLNRSESSSVKKPDAFVKKVEPKKKKTTITPESKTKTKETKKVEETKKTNHGVTDGMSFSKAFRTARNSHGGDGGVFTWKGKKYNTNLKKEKEEKTGDAKEKTDKKTAQQLIDEAKEQEKTTKKVTTKKKKKTVNVKATKEKIKASQIKYPEPWKPKYKRGGYKRRGGIK